MPKLASKFDCTGCMACVDACPFGALSYTVNDEGHYSYQIEKSKCMNCGKCEKVCAIVNGYEYGCNTFKLSEPYASWALDKKLRQRSTSGGVFAAIAHSFIINDNIVVGAAFAENNTIKHICIDKLEDLPRLQGSKYMQSNTSGIYKEVETYLNKGKKVLFSGTGCQIAGIQNYLWKNPKIYNLYTIDLICGGVPSLFLVSKFFEKYKNQFLSIHAFRNKMKYEFSVLDKNNRVKIIPLSQRPLPLCGFYTELTNRNACYDCKFAFAHRKSDITIGDLWGDTEYPEQHKYGLSVLVIHSGKGMGLTQQAQIALHPIKWKNFLLNNPRMIIGKNPKGNEIARKNLSIAFKTYSYSKILKMYANYAPLNAPLALLRKIARFIVGKYERLLMKKHINNILEKGK